MAQSGISPSVIAALSYAFFSTTLTLFNKAVLSSYHFEAALTLTLLQGIVTIVSLEMMKWRGWISYPNFSWRTAWQVLPLSIVFIAYVVMSLISLARVNVPMFTALRRLTVVLVMLEEYFYFGRCVYGNVQVTVFAGTVPSRPIMYSVCTQLFGAGLAAWNDLTFDPVSYFYLFLTNVFTSLYSVYINVARNTTKMNVFGLLYYNTVTTLPVLAAIAWWTGDLRAAWQFQHFRNVNFQISFQASIFMAVLLNVSTFYCTTLNTARTQTVIGQMKNFLAFLFGLVIFDDYIYDRMNFVGLMIGFAGGVQYSYAAYREKKQKAVLASLGAGMSNSDATVTGLAARAPSPAVQVALDETGDVFGGLKATYHLRIPDFHDTEAAQVSIDVMAPPALHALDDRSSLRGRHGPVVGEEQSEVMSLLVEDRAGHRGRFGATAGSDESKEASEPHQHTKDA